MTFNGVDESANSPDHDYWSAGADGTAANEPGISFGMWFKPSTSSSTFNLLLKGNGGANRTEWQFHTSASGDIRGTMHDASASSRIGRKVSGGVAANTWQFAVVTYGGNSNPSGVKIYVNGVRNDNADDVTGVYNAMENASQRIYFGYGPLGGGEFFYQGAIAAGPLGPFFTHATLNPSQIQELYSLGNTAMGQ